MDANLEAKNYEREEAVRLNIEADDKVENTTSSSGMFFDILRFFFLFFNYEIPTISFLKGTKICKSDCALVLGLMVIVTIWLTVYFLCLW